MTTRNKPLRVHDDLYEEVKTIAKENEFSLARAGKEAAELIRQAKKMFKKAQISSFLYIGATLFLFMLAIVFGYYISGQMNEVVNTEAIFAGTPRTMYGEYYGDYVSVFDKSFLFVIVGLVISTIISAFFIRSHPIFFAASCLLLIIFGVVFAIFGQTFLQLTTNTTLNASANNFTILPYIADNFVIILVILAFAALAVLFAKNYQGGL